MQASMTRPPWRPGSWISNREHFVRRSIRITLSAQQDILAIRRWTRQHFGSHQARTYARTLTLALQALHDGTHIPGAKRREDLGPVIHVLHVARQGRRGAHFIVFRQSGKHRIDVLRILHESMDLARQVEA